MAIWKVILLELIGLRGESWRQLATVFVEEYGEVHVLEELARQLVVPHGFAKILWHTRTNCVATRQLEKRLAILVEIIQRVIASANPSSKRGEAATKSEPETRA